ncbi:MAG TPA: cytochrome c oxidase subunit II [Mycobacteriales bacterium]|nr:cytochrome c oxidase subunit II [Mycobacteriales bacterium]
MRLGRATRLGVVFGLLGLAATGCSWNDMPRFGWPSAITPQGERMLHLWSASCIAALAVGVLVWGLIFWTVIFHRKKDDELPRQTKYWFGLEIFYSVVPLVIVAVLFYFTAVTQNYVTDESDKPDVTVTAVAFKWNWKFEYDDTKDNTGSTSVNTIGTSDTIPILVLPVDQKVRIEERSPDVIHSFWVPKLLFKRDVIPGLDNSFQITITKKGSYVGHCAELCGTYHSAMNFELRAVSQPDYKTYVNTLAKLDPGDSDRQAKALAAIGQPTKATTTHPIDTNRTAHQGI